MTDAAAALDEIDLRHIAAQTGADVRTIRKRMRGEPVRGVAGARIDRAIAARLAARAAGNEARNA